ncbi:MAG: sigma-70 family RNA polymerase sigma factor [Myxococcaceae bacterium]|nr:sigma-70 family RNA polymerase sigma factor [Myxococcaceae bacterium]
MSGTNDPARLLAHAGWVRVLATRLARGEDRDDAVQDVWLAALRSPPDESRPARPWLAQVLANAARRRFRDEATRQRHEQAGTGDEAPATPEALVARAELHTLVVNEVLALDEPFRQTVLLRFFEGDSSEDIARRAGVPAGTVRWRLKEGLDRVRASLDARYGARSSWLGALSPLLLPPAGPWLTTGVVLMEQKARVAVVVAAVALVAVIAGWASASTPSPEGGAAADSTADGHAHVRGPGPGPMGARVPVATAPSPSSPANEVRPAGLLPPASAAPTSAPTTVAAPAGVPPGVSGAVASTATDAGVRFAIDREGIRAAMRSALPEVKDCYEAWLAMNPSLGGRLVVTLTIDTEDGVEGRISRLAPLDAGLGHVPFEGCVLSSLSDLRFEPPLAGPVNVSYPFLFSAGDAGAP